MVQFTIAQEERGNGRAMLFTYPTNMLESDAPHRLLYAASRFQMIRTTEARKDEGQQVRRGNRSV